METGGGRESERDEGNDWAQLCGGGGRGYRGVCSSEGRQMLAGHNLGERCVDVMDAEISAV